MRASRSPSSPTTIGQVDAHDDGRGEKSAHLECHGRDQSPKRSVTPPTMVVPVAVAEARISRGQRRLLLYICGH